MNYRYIFTMLSFHHPVLSVTEGHAQRPKVLIQLTTENTFGVHSRFGNINDPFFASDVACHGMHIVLVAFVVKLVGLALDLIQDGTTKGNTILVFAHLLKQTGQSKPQQYGQQIFPDFGRYEALDIDFHMYVYCTFTIHSL